MRVLPLITLALAASFVTAQAPQPEAAKLVPVQTVEPTKTEALAIQSLRVEFQKAIADTEEVAQDIAKTHPGYHFNAATAQIEKDAPKPEPVKPAEVKK